MLIAMTVSCFAIAEGFVLYASVRLIAKLVRVRPSWLFPSIKSEIDREREPTAYWLYAAPYVIAIAFIPSALLIGLTARALS